MTQLVHLLSSSSFTINNFCLLAVFCSSRGRIPFITILRWFILFLRARAMQKRPAAIFQNRRYPGCLCHNWLQRTPAIVVEGCFPPSIIRFEPCRHQFHSLLYFHRRIYTTCWGIWGNLQQWSLRAKYRIRLFDDFMSAAWYLWFQIQFSLQKRPVG